MTERVLLRDADAVLEQGAGADDERHARRIHEISAHLSRFTVTEISLSDRALRPFDPAPILSAARLLADARVQVIA
jgi:hypothetical protein